jgi:hypothetical protein
MDTSLNLSWLGVALVAPTIIGLIVAWPLWAVASRDSTLGSAVAAGAVMVAILVLFAREYIEVDRMRLACPTCLIRPRDFTRYSLIGIAGAVDMIIVFVLGLWYEERRHRAAT